MFTPSRSIRASQTTAGATFMLLLLIGCGGGAGSDTVASAPGGGAGPDTSALAEMILARINQDPMRMEMKVTGKLTEFSVTSTETQVLEGMGATAVVKCAGVAVFDGDVEWNWQAMEPKKAGEPAKFECDAEYFNPGNGWQPSGAVGIHPL